MVRQARDSSRPRKKPRAQNHHGLVCAYYGSGVNMNTTDDALSTVTTVEHDALIMRNNTARGDQGQMTTPVVEPIRTITTTGHQSSAATLSIVTSDWNRALSSPSFARFACTSGSILLLADSAPELHEFALIGTPARTR
jgi:hypothetical protein